MAQQDDRNKRDDQHKMSPQEAGKLGGEATARTHDREFYESIGSEGGSVSPGNFKNDPKRAAEAGARGGAARGQDRDEDLDEAA